MSDTAVTRHEEVTVTGTREAQTLAETPASIGIVGGETLRQDKPAHPTEVMGQVPGVHVNITNGEGHMTAIRQPITTSPVYLFLEDGVPVRSTGFFNHNALYEINVPQAGGVEINRGPGTALYGSDAIGGVVNVLTRTPPATGEVTASAEAGGHGWKRILAGGGNTHGVDAWRADVNLTDSDGWRDATAYDRQSATARWDHAFGDNAVAKTVLSYSTIDQQTGANAPLIQDDYDNHPTKNYHSIAFREVDAVRLSSAFERESGDTLVSVIPYVRDDSMTLLPNFTLSFDPQLYTTSNQSFGVLSKWRKDFEPLRARLIVGLDLDYSPGGREENSLTVTSTGTGASRVFTSYTVGPRTYEYDVAFLAVSPYLHAEFSPSERLRVTAGLRYDDMRYDYDNNLTDNALQVGSSFYGHAADTSVNFSHVSPKLGATYAVGENTSVFAAWNHGFRAPSESQLFRPTRATSAVVAQGNAQSALGLDPIKADQFEVGARGRAAGMNYDLAVYYLSKQDDIVSFRDPATNVTQSMNAGETLHRGVEAGLGIPLGGALRLDAALSYATHFYREWQVSPTADLNGKEIESAPRRIGNTRLSWVPAAGRRVQLEWVNLGSYWMDQANTTQYDGHNLFNLRANWPLASRLSVFGSVHNLTDVRYAESASISSSTPVFAPGLPRTLYAGVEATW
ncbi:MAG: TonB-dependent receptor [Sulfuricaulis sp.]|uniref:TonB-dependent receptor n=1 Tax=Sulfuricaulis sp. TaxID=2003553 RepID=UPI0025EA2855|nr:TonB-dependent receptor [Sulfuricaulis sp.]MCR4348126.1 TonB-dependent receptor [Sulfuricaulis sp.]